MQLVDNADMVLAYHDVSIPQAVGTVATDEAHRSLIAEYAVSIPQAVGTVATNNHLIVSRGVRWFQYRKR